MGSASSLLVFTGTQLSQHLRTARKQRGLTQAEMAAQLGLSQNRVSYLESHADELSVKQLLTWCSIVGLELTLGERPTLAMPGKAPADDAAEW